MAPENSARLVWFWTFWHWSQESFRDGVLLRSPLQGVGSHWDEWFRHEASAADRAAIARVGATEAGQRQFIAWFFRHWAPDAAGAGSRPIARYVACQLAGLEPFNQWKPFARYRGTYGVTGVSAVVLAENSAGESADVRPVEAVVLPAERAISSAKVVAEGFEPDGAELSVVERACASLLAGRTFGSFLALWIACGRRPGPAWWRALVAAAWLAVGGMILCLWFGPDPGDQLVTACAGLLVAWGFLTLHAGAVVVREAWRAWQLGRALLAQFAQSQVRLHMNGGLFLQGASAGLAFCLNTLVALFRTLPVERRHRSWLWQRSLGELQRTAGSWAATGVLTSEGWVHPVVLDPKLRACLRQPGIERLITPRQHEARQREVNRLAADLAGRGEERAATFAPGLRLGFAATGRTLGVHPAGHLAQVMMKVGGLLDRRQLAMNFFAAAVSVVMLVALPDLLRILRPPEAPVVVSPSSASPYYLWVSLDTDQPKSFRVRFESEFWASRIADVRRYEGGDLVPRAEMHVQRLPAHLSRDEDDGVIWIERRRSFLTREFLPGERVGRYPLSYVIRLSHD